MSWITGVGLTRFGRLEPSSTLDLMSQAATAALADARLERSDVDGLICGYSTTMPHLMLSTVFAEHFGLQPQYAHAVQLGGATGFAMAMLAHHLVEAGAARRILVVAGENRLTGQTRDASIQTLAQVGHPVYEVQLGPTIPAYYGLVASRYMHEYGITEPDLAELAVLMRSNAARHPGAQFREPISVADVMTSKPIAAPLKFLDCCPVSDGGAAFVVERETERFRGRQDHRGRAGAYPPACQRRTVPGAVRGGGLCPARARQRRSVARRYSLCRYLRQLHHYPRDPA